MLKKSKPPRAAFFVLLLLSLTLSVVAMPRVNSKPGKKNKATQMRCSEKTDADIVNDVKARLQTNPDIAKQMSHLNVSSKRRVVKLEGWLAGKGNIARALSLARTTKCVKRVITGKGGIKTKGGGSCGPGLKPCGDICIDKNSDCNLGT